MQDSIWLTLALPLWYFSTIVHPFSAGMLTAIPALGILCLATGALAGAIRVERRLFLFLISVVFSELFVGIAGLLRGAFAGSSARPMLLVFLVVQMGLVGYLTYRLRSVWTAAIPLAIFCITYALFAAFISSMAFSNVWL